MKKNLKQIIANFKEEDRLAAKAREEEANSPVTKNERRSFLKKTALGGLSLGAMMYASIEDTVAETTSKVNRYSNPSDLKITDMRVAVLRNVGRTPLLRLRRVEGIRHHDAEYLWRAAQIDH
jgi:hypothetical protein